MRKVIYYMNVDCTSCKKKKEFKKFIKHNTK